ncbi:hypothetical protein DFH06DRAFT_1193578 [Mycena polygramma]|nr:hypothetical protein DFH06DRAFT_1193578 [Mycena polygramma]
MSGGGEGTGGENNDHSDQRDDQSVHPCDTCTPKEDLGSPSPPALAPRCASSTSTPRPLGRSFYPSYPSLIPPRIRKNKNAKTKKLDAIPNPKQLYHHVLDMQYPSTLPTSISSHLLLFMCSMHDRAGDDAARGSPPFHPPVAPANALWPKMYLYPRNRILARTGLSIPHLLHLARSYYILFYTISHIYLLTYIAVLTVYARLHASVSYITSYIPTFLTSASAHLVR